MLDESKIHKIAHSRDVEERKKALNELRKNFEIFVDKKEAWDDLHNLTQDKDEDVRGGAADSLGRCYSYIPDKYKKQACDDLHRLTQDRNDDVRKEAAFFLGFCYSHIPDKYKKQAWDDLHRLTQDRNDDVRSGAVFFLGSCYSHIPDEYKKQAWDDLIRLTQDKNNIVQSRAADSLGSCYSHIPDEYKKQAWDDLIRLTHDQDNVVRRGAANSLGSCYSHIPEEYKKQAWDDLHRLTQDRNNDVRRGAANSLGSCYSHIPDEYKKQAWDDLHRLTQDKKDYVRITANHSSGRVSIYRASQAKGDDSVRKELEIALRFFERASKGSTYFNPAKFCLPFYRSFYTITFRKEEAKAEVKRYLAEAKNVVEGSKSKKTLLEAVENLGNALTEMQKVRDIDAIKSDINAYRRYCDRACELLDITEDKAPGATRLIRRGLPIIDERIKEIIIEIQGKANALCKKTKDTPLEPLGIETNHTAKQLSESEYLSLDIGLNKMITGFKEFCDFIPNEKRRDVCSKLNIIEKMDVPEKGQAINELLYYLLDNIDIPRINKIPIGIRKKEIVKIASVQLYYKLSTDTFPPVLYENEKENIKMKAIKAIRIALQNRVNILCLPELCICENWLPELKKECGSMILIPGSYYDDRNHNLSPIICTSDIDVPPQLKFNPSVFEDSKITGLRMARENKLINIYETDFGNFSVLICRDFGNFISFLRGKLDIVFVPSYNSANKRFHKEADNHVTNSPSYVIISNSAEFGGTSIFGQINNGYFPALAQKGFRKKGDESYKLCEIGAKKEGIIIADFNLVHKSPPLQMPINPDDEVCPVLDIQIIEL